MIIQLCLSAGLAIIVSAMCSVFEAVLYSLPLSQIEIVGKKHKQVGRILLSLKKDIHRPIIAILTLNTIANTSGAAIAGAAAAAVFGEQNMIWFSIIFTSVILTFSEIIPKTLGVAYCRDLSLWISYPLLWIVNVLKPVIWMIQTLTRLLPAKEDALLVSGEEIQALARQSQKSGEISMQERRVITNILDLKGKSVRSVMTPLTVTFMLDGNLTVLDAMGLKENMTMHSRIPVYDQHIDNVIGLLLLKDLLTEVALGGQHKKIKELIQPVHFVPETARLSSVMPEFFDHSKHLFVVVDEYGSVTGVISLEDIFEEIIGREIIDESDQATDMRELAKRKRSTLLSHLATLKDDQQVKKK
ncbi:MAG: hemolysin family protein [Desulfobulbaceae bacterium]|nr:hemolysin family protein [Desulfobulbaceae bacterium]HIJ77813.1 HlyC/CorC family transporter [Deltaproteobacteria bacterium]